MNDPLPDMRQKKQTTRSSGQRKVQIFKISEILMSLHTVLVIGRSQFVPCVQKKKFLVMYITQFVFFKMRYMKKCLKSRRFLVITRPKSSSSRNECKKVVTLVNH